MDDHEDRAQLFTRRAFVVGAAQGLLLTVLGGRLAWLQVAQGERYKTLAENNRINVKMIAPSRGVITDRAGIILAQNDQNFRALVIPEQTKDLKNALQALNDIVPLEDSAVRKILKRAKKNAEFVPLEIKDNLAWKEVSAIEVRLPDLPGIMIDVGEIRSYPLKDATAHVVGYVGPVTSKEDIGRDPILSLPGFRIGKTGIEKSRDQDLRGRVGTAEVEVNVVGREVRELRRDEGTRGSHTVLTLDSGLQDFTQERLKKTRSACAVVMDIYSGEVYALASHPGFDPNLFTHGMSAEVWEELLSDPGKPLTNKAVSGLYPPGSTFKLVTALAGLESGAINKRTRAHCPGHYSYGNDRFHCWKAQGHGHMDVVSAMSESCDTYFYKMATEVGIEKIAEMARRLGLGQKYDFALKEERAGLIPDKGWKISNFGTNWQPGETIVASIGQGYIQATPLQMAVMTARVVNGGYKVEPRLIARPFEEGALGKDASQEPGVERESLNIPKPYIDLILRGMNNAVNHEQGTAFLSKIRDSSKRMGGKTGTAQVRRISMQDRLEGVRNQDLPWRFRHHALFVGYAPLKKPRYVCCVVVEHGGSGSAAAAPVARDILLEAQKRNPSSVMPVFDDPALQGYRGGQRV